MEKELIKLFEAVKKAADGARDGGDLSREEDRCVDALKRLEKFPVNYDVLVSTKVGKSLRRLTKHPRKKIQDLASKVVEMWKKIAIEGIKNNRNMRLGKKDSSKSEPEEAEKIDLHSGKVMKSETILVQNVCAVNIGPIRTPVAPPKLASVVKCKDDSRNKIRELLSEALCKVSSETNEDEVNACDPFGVAVEVESAMFKYWGRFNGVHKLEYRSVMFNIKDPRNPDFRRKVLLGHVKPEGIPKMTPAEMASNQRQSENEKLKEKALFECQRGESQEATTNEFRCGRCGKNETTYHQMQTRSADEPMTTYVTCVNCNNHWRF
ncbi:hypothetical protein F0562_026398 [Nyssa sinensis]|uniref:Transcription elongation factor n=1 Tax=Nyssa sinensis TaxID=561372 RepID=A0A5J5BBB6_9ASTE|nr:hypothetical protein F0562_026398 [Nyssa sinensis]